MHNAGVQDVQKTVRSMAVLIVVMLVTSSLLLQSRLDARDAVSGVDATAAEIQTSTTRPPTDQKAATPPHKGPGTSTTVRARGGQATTTSIAVDAPKPPPTVPPAEPWDFPVELSKSCAIAGDSMTITFRLVYGAVAGMMAVYSDSSTRKETNRTGAAGQDGVFTYTWVVDAAMPSGEVALTTMAYDGRRGGTKLLPFRIGTLVEPC